MVRGTISATLFLAALLVLPSSAGAQYPSEPSRECNAFWHHLPHDWSPVTCERENNPHYLMEMGMGYNTCLTQAPCCKGCYSCCNNSRDQKINCFCEEKPFWQVEQCQNAANTRAPYRRGECIGTFEADWDGVKFGRTSRLRRASMVRSV